MRRHALAFLATLALSLSTAPAQPQVFGGESERMATTKMIFTPQFELLGAICIQYGQPKWKAEYEGMVEQAKGRALRLGKDFWTTMNTTVPFKLGGIDVPAGAWYLGLECDAKGDFHLLVIDARKADKNGWSPFGADQWQADHRVPMTKATAKDSVEKLAITVGGTEASTLELKIAWGTHTLTAPAAAVIAAPKDTKPAAPGKRG